MADQKPKTEPTGRLRDKPWLKGTDLYFVEYGLFLFLLTVALWTFDALILSLFSYIANSAANFISYTTAVAAVSAAFVFIPALYILWRRVRSEESRRPDVWLRKAHRWPLYVFVIVQALIGLYLAYLVSSSLVSAMVNEFVDFGRVLLSTALPALLGLVIHGIAVIVMLDKDQKKERSFMNVLVLGSLALVVILLLTLGIKGGQPDTIDPQDMFFPNRSESLEDLQEDDSSLRERNFFDY